MSGTNAEGGGTMFDGIEESREGRTDEGHPVAGEEVGAPEEGPGSAKEEVTPKIADDAEKGQTTHPAPDDDVGVPEDPGTPSEDPEQ